MLSVWFSAFYSRPAKLVSTFECGLYLYKHRQWTSCLVSILSKMEMPKSNGNSHTQLHKLMIYKLASIPIADKHFVMRSRTIRLHYRGGYTSFLFVLVCAVFFPVFLSHLKFFIFDLCGLGFRRFTFLFVSSDSVCVCVVVFVRRAVYTILNAFVRKIIFWSHIHDYFWEI